METRKLKSEEIELIIWMIKDKPGGMAIIETLPSILVQEMDDGGMGSLRVLKEGKENRLYGGDLAQGDFSDIDGVPVFISVVLDKDGDFFDLEVFKGDFSPLKKFPEAPKF